MSGRASLYLRTVSHLRPSQAVHRVRLRGQRALLSRLPPTLLERSAAPAAARGWPATFMPLPMEECPPADDLAAHRFRFLEHTRSLGDPPDWHQPDASQLWRYHLHYFDWAWTFAAHPDREWARATFVRLWESWRAHVTVGRGDAWAPYVASVRAWNWCGVHERLMADGPRDEQWRAALATHAAYARAFLELDVGGNHLLKNLKALVGLGVFLHDDGLLATARRHLERQVGVQVLADGGHYERSPSYHAQALGDLIDISGLLAAAGQPPVPGLEDAVAAMRAWLVEIVRPDGELPLLNDCVPARTDHLGLPAPANRMLTVLDPSGYAVLRADRLHLIADVGVPCPPDLPAHAHADCLSFELSVDGVPVVVDTGVSTYEPGARRAYERSTAAHNTVEVDGADQTEVWGVFRAARLATPALEHAAAKELTASHDGYERLPGKPRHRRTWRIHDGTVEIVDLVSGRGTHRIVSRLYLGPGLAVREEGAVVVAGPVRISIEGTDIDVAVRPCELGNGFGRRIPSAVVETSVSTRLPFELRTTVTVEADAYHPRT